MMNVFWDHIIKGITASAFLLLRSLIQVETSHYGIETLKRPSWEVHRQGTEYSCQKLAQIL